MLAQPSVPRTPMVAVPTFSLNAFAVGGADHAVTKRRPALPPAGNTMLLSFTCFGL